MATYKDCKKVSLGYSDISSLILVGCKANEGLKIMELHFGKDGNYKAYIANADTEIGNHYTKVATFNHWLKIYDDEGLTYKVNAKEINIYRAGELGCVIQIIKEEGGIQ